MKTYFLKTQTLIKNHWPALVLALAVGLIYLAPHIFFAYSLGKNFSGVQFSPLDAENHTLTVFNEIKSGYTNYANPFLYEYKNTARPILEYSEIIYGLLVKYLHLSIGAFYLFAKFVFPLVIFLLWYWLSLLIMRNRKSAILSALLLVFGYSLLENLSLIKQLSIIFWHANNLSPLLYGRIVNPLLSFPFFFLGLIAVYKLFKNKNLKSAVICGLVLGVNFYIYFYFWAYLITLLGIMFLYEICKIFKNKSGMERLFIRNILISFGIAFIVGFYYIFQMIKVAYFNVYENAASKVLTPYIVTHKFVFPTTVFVALLLFMMYWLFKNKREGIESGDKFILILLLTSVIVVNQQVLTGRFIEQGHFQWYTNIPVVFLSLAAIFNYLVEKIKKNYAKLAICIIACLYILFFGIGIQASGYKKYFNDYKYYQNYGIIFNWLTQNSEKESVVLGNDDFSGILPAYTDNNAYYASYVVYYPTTPLDRRLWAVDVYYYLNYRDKKDIDQEFKNRKVELGALALPLVNYRNDCGSYDCYPDEFLQKMIDGYKIFAKNSFEENLKKYRIDYVVWDRNKNPEWNLGEFDFLQLIYSVNNINLYKLIK